MKAVTVGTLFLAGILVGCTADPANPNLLAPKVVLHPWPDGNVTVYVHSAFGEHDYAWISLAVDNETVANQTRVFSLEERVPSDDFFMTVRAQASEQMFEVRGRVELDRAREKALVSLVDARGEWDEPRSFNLPFERILDRVKPVTGDEA